MTKDATAPNVDWAAVQHDYEIHALTNATICQCHGITRSQLRYRIEKFGWVAFRARRIDRPVLVKRLLKIFDRQLRQLEKTGMIHTPEDVSLLATATRTLDKILAIKQVDRPRQVEEDDMDDLRDKLAERFDQLKKR
ncbi:hypothetical protein [Devosia sp.]|uniref:hypothetical protein n=1 Tax=Devosia sp. TaxID=1871048 RepID=UPI002734BF81|nr:hypothetical protein [Devosia sp.]MDP2782894.1 hypothetical protein [Devosia sp.]